MQPSTCAMTNAEQWVAAEDANGKGVTDLRKSIHAGLEVLRSATLRASFQDGQPQNFRRLKARYEPITYIATPFFSFCELYFSQFVIKKSASSASSA